MTEWKLLTTDGELRQLLNSASGATAVAVDTEFMRRNTFYPQVALVQLWFVDSDAAGTGWLIDPLTLDDPTPLGELLENDAVVKILHSASEDLEVFQRWLGVLPRPLFDTQRAAALLDMGFGLGYGALVDKICGVELPKGETRSDWLRRPLTESQCEYAALDVIWLARIWTELAQRCTAADKYDWVLADGADALAVAPTENRLAYKKIKNAWKLNRRQLGALQAVCQWREETARQRDKPRNWIIDDRCCMDLALCSPNSTDALAAEVEIPPPALRRYGGQLLALLQQQAAVPATELPEPLPAPLDSSKRQLLKQLKRELKVVASGLVVAPEALLSSRDLEALVRESTGDVFEAPRPWQGWRRDRVLAPLRKLLEGPVA